MASNKLRDDMVEYIGIESATEGKKSSSPQDRNGESPKHLDDGSTGKSCPSQDGSHGISNGSYSQKNELQITNEETIEEKGSLKNGIDISPGLNDMSAETLKQSDCVPNKVNISNSDSRNGINVSSSSKNGLDVSKNGEEAEDVSKKDEEKGHVYSSMQEREKTPIVIPLSSTASCISSKFKLNRGPQEDVPERKYQQNGLKIAMVDVVMEGKGSQGEDRSSNESASSKGVPLLDTDAERRKRFLNGSRGGDRSSNESASSKGVPLLDTDAERRKWFINGSQDEDRCSNESASSADVPSQDTDSERRKRFTEQTLMYMKKYNFQSKIDAIDNLVCQLTGITPPAISEIYETKPAHPKFDSEDQNKPEHALPKRKSKQSEFEDPEELQLMSKKAKMNTMEEQSTSGAQSGVSEQFRNAYREAIDEDQQGPRNKTFNFAEDDDNDFLKEKLRFETELDEIANRVLRAMSLDLDVSPEKPNKRMQGVADNYTDENAVSRGMQTEKEVWKFSRDGYNFRNSPYPRVLITSKDDQPLVNDGVSASSRRPTDDDTESTTFKGTSFSKKALELLKSLVLLILLIPFLFLTCVTAKMCSLCFPTEEWFKNSKSYANSRDLKRKLITKK